MRNLKIIKKHGHASIAIDSSSSVFCCGDLSHIYICDKHTGEIPRLIRVGAEGDEGVQEVLCQDVILEDVFQMVFIATTGSLYMATRTGAFLQAFVGLNIEVQELFKSEQGIARFAVSPDSRLVTIVTRKSTLLLLTLPDLECLSQQVLQTNDENPVKDGNASIAWRSDSQYFAINVATSDENCWKIHVYDENGGLYASTEECNPLSNKSLSWQPSGGLIAAYGRSPHGNVVIFFELNGLKRADFSPYDGRQAEEKQEVLDFLWNSSSDILALRLKDSVELWTRNNYVWMRKKILRNQNEEGKNSVHFSEWDTELPYRIHVVFQNGVYKVYDLSFEYACGLSGGSALTASWNGNNVYCTPFRDNCAPPPFGYMQAKVEADIVTVVVSNHWDGLLCVTDSGKIILLKNEKTALIPVKTYQCPDKLLVREVDNWIWPNKSTLCCAYNSTIVTFSLPDFDPQASDNEVLVFKDNINFEELSSSDCTRKICRIEHFSDGLNESDWALVESSSKIVFLVNIKTQECITVCKLPETCTSVKFLRLSDERNLLLFGLNSLTRKVFVGWSKYPHCEPVKISVDCTSISTYADNLLLTTTQASLEILSKDYLIETLSQTFSDKQPDQEICSPKRYSRKIEKGSSIVSCCLNQMLEPSLVLQVIPRGNLETIFPRPLLISTLRVILREKENQVRYEKIMIALRRHRVDYKVLIDEMKHLSFEDPTMSLETSLRLMVDQVKDSHSLVLLVTDLDADYLDCIRIIKELLEKSVISESNENVRQPHIEEAYLASLAKLGFLEEALRSQLIVGQSKENRNVVKHHVNFLSYYCENPDILFDTAIGTYDLGLASLVADCLGKDPKEYLPILDGFQSLPEGKRLFKIDDKLRRYAKAIVNLILDSTVQHDEILKYMERHRLFTDALDFIKTTLANQTNETNRDLEDLSTLLYESNAAYGRYLEEHGKLQEACIFFRGGKLFNKAIDCAVKSGAWETALEILYSQNAEHTEIEVLCERILESLEDKQNYSSAARVCEVYLIDIPRAVGYWIKDRKWLRAKALTMRLPHLGEGFSVETLYPKVIEATNERQEYLESLQRDVIQKVERLRIVKAIKARRLTDMGEYGNSDTFSDTDSVSTGSLKSGSVSTGKTYRSGKNKRKMERKLYSLKEGSAYEDLGITAHLWTLFEKIQVEIKPDTSHLVESLWVFELNDLALNLGRTFDTLLAECNKAILEIWATFLTEEVLDLRFRVPPVGWSTSWDKLCLHESSSKAVKQQNS